MPGNEANQKNILVAKDFVDHGEELHENVKQII